MTIETRRLTIDDQAAMADVIRSRSHYLSSSQIDKPTLIHRLTLALSRPQIHVIGLFENGELDGFFTWEPVGPSPRADDILRTDAAALVHAQWSRSKAGGRAKLPSGHDVLSGHLVNASIQSMDDAGLFTYWYATPAAWANTPQRDNPIHAEMRAKRAAQVVAIIAPGAQATGPYAGYIRRSIMATNVETEPLAIHVVTLKDEFRPSQPSVVIEPVEWPSMPTDVEHARELVSHMLDRSYHDALGALIPGYPGELDTVHAAMTARREQYAAAVAACQSVEDLELVSRQFTWPTKAELLATN